MSALELTLYHRRGCHLCDEMLDELEALCHGRVVDIRLVDIDTDATLSARYGADIPVLARAGTEICRHRLDPAAVQALF